MSSWLNDRAPARRPRFLSAGLRTIPTMALRPWRELDADVFRFTTTGRRDLHVAVMAAFEHAGVLAPVLNLDGVRSALRQVRWDEPVADDELVSVLAALAGWGLLEVSQDHTATYATPEEFERRNLQWSLAPKGEAAVAGLLAALESLRHVASLQPAVLHAIGDALAEVADVLEAPPTAATDDVVWVRLKEVEAHLAGLVTSVRQFNTQLQRLVRAGGEPEGPAGGGVDGDAAPDVFLEVKQRTVSYLRDFVDDVDRPRRRVQQAMARLDGRLADVFDRAVRGANLAPLADDDPRPTWIAERERRWEALAAWFAPGGGARPRVDGLLDVARAAIIELLRVLERRWDERRRSASVARDLRALADRFAAAPSEDDAHRLFHAAFGLWPARHAHLAAEDAEPRQPRRAWGETDPVEVAPSLRTTGTLDQRGRSRPVADPDRFRTHRLRAQAEALAAHHQVRAALVTDGLVRLADLPALDPAAFAELLVLLAAALDARPSADGARRALSVDGQVEVVLTDADGADARLRTEAGVLTAPNFGVEIHLTDTVEAPTALVAVGGGAGRPT